MTAIEGSQTLNLFCALILATVVVVSLVDLVFSVLNNGFPLGILAIVFFVLPHKLRVPLLFLHSAVGQQTQNLSLLALLRLLDPLKRL